MPRRVIKEAAALPLIVLIAATFTACGDRGQGQAANNNDTAVAATVNGKNVMLKEVDQLISQQMKGQQAQMSPLELGAARMQVLDDLVRQEVLYQRAEKEKLLPTDDEVAQAINEQMQQSGMTQEAYQKALKDSGQTEQGLRDIARRQLAIKKLLDRVSSKVQTPSDKEVEDYYNNNRQRYVSARGVSLATIVVDPKDNGATNDAKGDTDAKAKIDRVYQRLKSGADFASVAREESEDQNTVLRGGDIGFLTEDDLKQAGFPQELTARFFTMQTGDITPPVRASDGRWTIFKLAEKRLQSENLTFDNPDVRKDATENILNQRKQLLNAAFLQVATNESKITNTLASNMVDNPLALSSLRPAGSATPNAPVASPSPASSANTAATPMVSPAVKAANTNSK